MKVSTGPPTSWVATFLAPSGWHSSFSCINGQRTYWRNGVPGNWRRNLCRFRKPDTRSYFDIKHQEKETMMILAQTVLPPKALASFGIASALLLMMGTLFLPHLPGPVQLHREGEGLLPGTSQRPHPVSRCLRNSSCSVRRHVLCSISFGSNGFCLDW